MITVQNREDFLFNLRTFLPLDCCAAELGVLHGDFSKQILDVIKPKTFYLIDPYSISESRYGTSLTSLTTAYSNDEDYSKILKRFECEITTKQVSIIKKMSYEAVIDFPDQSLDFNYIDASHLYKDVKQDLNDWLPKLKPHGLMCGHDYIESDTFGVIQAVDEFIEEHELEMIILNENGGDWALRKK